jgi:hypothetical protein
MDALVAKPHEIGRLCTLALGYSAMIMRSMNTFASQWLYLLLKFLFFFWIFAQLQLLHYYLRDT